MGKRTDKQWINLNELLFHLQYIFAWWLQSSQVAVALFAILKVSIESCVNVRPQSESHGPLSSSVSCCSGKRPTLIYMRRGSTGPTCRDPENRTGPSVQSWSTLWRKSRGVVPKVIRLKICRQTEIIKHYTTNINKQIL